MMILQSGGACDKAAIIGLDGSILSDPLLVSFKLTTQESTVIGIGMMESDMSYPSLRENGIIVEGIRYDFLRADDNMVWGRKQGEGTITMERSKQNVVICHTKEGDNLGNAKRVVEKVVDSFEYYGY